MLQQFLTASKFLSAAVLLLVLTFYFVPVKVAPFSFPENKVWKHRQNTSSQAIQSVEDGIRGIELDLHLLNGTLHVAHDPTEFENAEKLSVYLARLQAANALPHLWFDLKNLTFANEMKIRKEILRLVDQHNLQKRLLVESPWPSRMFRLCQGKIQCSVWVQNADNFVFRMVYRPLLRALSRFANVSSMSVDYRARSYASAIVPDGFPALLYTFPSGFDLTPYIENGNHSVLLSD